MEPTPVRVSHPSRLCCGTDDDHTTYTQQAIAFLFSFTGIIPILSLFKQHVADLVRLNPESHFNLLQERQQRLDDIQSAEQSRQGSIAQQLMQPCCAMRKRQRCGDMTEGNDHTSKDSAREESTRNLVSPNGKASPCLHGPKKELKNAAWNARISIFGTMALVILVVFGVTLIALTISWNTISIKLYDGMVVALKLSTLVFQACYAIVALCLWDADNFLTIVDMALIVVSLAVDMYWFGIYNTSENGTLRPVDILTFSLFIGYMTGRVWAMTVRPHRHQAPTASSLPVLLGSSRPSNLERLDVVWVSTSASLIAEILPFMENVYQELSSAWGEANAQKACRLSVYCTDQDRHAQDMLHRVLSSSSRALYQQGMVKFEKPNFGGILQEHAMELVETRRSSQSLVACSGWPQLAKDIHQCKLANDMVVSQSLSFLLIALLWYSF